MRIILILLTTFLNVSLTAQVLKFTDLQGEKPIGKFTSYISKNGETYSVGDTLSVGSPSGVNGQFLFIGNHDFLGTEYPVTTTAINAITVIKSIYVKGTKKIGWKAAMNRMGIYWFRQVS